MAQKTIKSELAEATVATATAAPAAPLAELRAGIFADALATGKYPAGCLSADALAALYPAAPADALAELRTTLAALNQRAGESVEYRTVADAFKPVLSTLAKLEAGRLAALNLVAAEECEGTDAPTLAARVAAYYAAREGTKLKDLREAYEDSPRVAAGCLEADVGRIVRAAAVADNLNGDEVKTPTHAGRIVLAFVRRDIPAALAAFRAAALAANALADGQPAPEYNSEPATGRYAVVSHSLADAGRYGAAWFKSSDRRGLKLAAELVDYVGPLFIMNFAANIAAKNGSQNSRVNEYVAGFDIARCPRLASLLLLVRPDSPAEAVAALAEEITPYFVDGAKKDRFALRDGGQPLTTATDAVRRVFATAVGRRLAELVRRLADGQAANAGQPDGGQPDGQAANAAPADGQPAGQPAA